MDKKLNSVVVLVALVVVGFVSWQLGYKEGISKGGLPGQLTGLSPQSFEMRGTSGIVEKIGNSDITIKTFTQGLSGENNLSSRVVLITQDTIIERLTQKDTETINKEQAVFMGKMKKSQTSIGVPADTELPLPPEPFTREKISLKDIKVGDNAIVTADENIATKSRFTAKNISVQVMPNIAVPVITAPIQP